ncbi:MAG: stage 0 sporulation family protein [Clostridia bacterium]|nr:stage 0 sporulation family protein [Clostridia bacterium]
MAIVVGIKFKTNQKIYYFDPKDIELTEGDSVILETARGIEFGKVVQGIKEVSDDEVVAPLKPIIRKATQKDEEQNEANLKERDRLVKETVQKVTAHNLPMKIVDAEYTFDRAKIIIYFTAESRIDFRELVRDLAGLFHNRIELRQIYEREDIKLRGALAQCGRPCCCTTFLQDYEKVSMKMAKYQGLSLNPTKINGCCGKLMCCLRYENAYYQDMSKKMPKEHSTVITPDGEATVMENDALRQEVKVKIETEEGAYTIKRYPLADIKSKNSPSQNVENDLED